MVNFNGTYKLEKNENLEEFLAAMGVGAMKRKMASMARPSVEVKVEGDTWTIVTSSTLKTATWTFTLGEEKELQNTSDSSMIKAIFTLEGNRLIQKTTEGDGSKCDIVREFTDDAMIQIITHKESGTKATRTHKRV